jgi:hypothetical protein
MASKYIRTYSCALIGMGPHPVYDPSAVDGFRDFQAES